MADTENSRGFRRSLDAGEESLPAGLGLSSLAGATGVVPRILARSGDAVRRFLDIALSLTALILFAPVMVVIAVLVKLDSSGPAIFRQHRVGIDRRRGGRPRSGPNRRKVNLHGKPFTLYKYRTMYADAMERFPRLYRPEYTEEELRHLPIKVLFSQQGKPDEFKGGWPQAERSLEDPRVPPIGRWLRKTSLDELPNFINVLKGDMHLVGPRPEIPVNVRFYPPEHLKKFWVKPGVTGLSQVNGRGYLSFFRTAEYDLQYVESRSLALDLLILLKTIPALVSRKGAY